MAFQAGTQIRPELANADYSGFVNAANIRAQAMMNLGEQIGGAIKDYQIKKEEGEQRKIRYETILPYMQDKFNEEDAKNLSNLFAKQPKDFNAVYQFMALEQDTNILKDAFAVSTTPEGKVDYESVLPSYMALGGGDAKLATEAVQAKMEMDKLGLAQSQEARLAKTSEAEIDLAQRNAELAKRKFELEQQIFDAQQKGDTVAAQQAQAELDETKAKTQEIKAKTEEIGKPKALTPTQRLDILETEVNDVKFSKYLQELTQAKSIEGGEIHQKGLFNFDEDQIAAFDNILRAYPEFLQGMPQVVKDHYGVKSTPGGGNLVITKREN
jgi:hypothetical protein